MPVETSVPFSQPVCAVVENFYETLQYWSYNSEDGSITLLNLDKLDFFNVIDGSDFINSSDNLSQSELLGDADPYLFRFFFERRSRLDLFVSRDEFQFAATDEGDDGGVVSILGPSFLTYLTFISSRLSDFATDLA